MFYEEIITKHDLTYISICSLSILYNSKFIFTAMSLGTNAVVVLRVVKTFLCTRENTRRMAPVMCVCVCVRACVCICFHFIDT